MRQKAGADTDRTCHRSTRRRYIGDPHSMGMFAFWQMTRLHDGGGVVQVSLLDERHKRGPVLQ